MFVVLILVKDGKEVPLEVHISKASRAAKDLELQGVKFRIGQVKYYESTPSTTKSHIE